MIDNLLYQSATAAALPTLRNLGLERDGKVGQYILVTLHRPSNVDEEDMLRSLVATLERLAKRAPILFPVHPRTRQRMEKAGLLKVVVELNPDEARADALPAGLYLMPPLPYNTFLALMQKAVVLLTDSGGVQEETTVLGVPCLTLRENTERPITVSEGTNTVVGRDLALIERMTLEALDGKGKKGTIPEGWDGKAAIRICESIVKFLESRSTTKD